MTPEQKARVSIDALLQQAGCYVGDVSDVNTHASVGVATRESPLLSSFGANLAKQAGSCIAHPYGVYILQLRVTGAGQ